MVKVKVNAVAAPQSAGLGWRIPWPVVIGVFLAGLGLRLWLLDVGTREGYVWDHFDSVSRAETVRKVGLLNVYTLTRDDLVEVPGQVWQNGQFHPHSRRGLVVFNYPPLSPTILLLESYLLPRPVLANTFSARLAMSIVPILLGLAAAVGLAVLVRDLLGPRAAVWAGALCWLAPPVALNSTFWGQVDAYFLAPAVWSVWLMLRRRWLAAGGVLAIACLLKPQGLILGPVALLAALTVAETDGGAGLKTVLWRLVKTGGAFLAGVAALSLPWMLTSGLAWLDRSYRTSFLEAFPLTTLKGFNLWYLDALIQDARLAADPLSSQATVLGITKDAWGRLLTLAAMVGFAVLTWRRFGRRPMGLVTYAAIWLWSVFMLPTRVHERFIIYCVPFVIVAALPARRLWPALVLMLLVGAAEHTWPVWLKGLPAGSMRIELAYQQNLAKHQEEMASLPPHQRQPFPTREQFDEMFRQRFGEKYRQRRQEASGIELMVTILSLLGYGWFAAAAFMKPANEKKPLARARG